MGTSWKVLEPPAQPCAATISTSSPVRAKNTSPPFQTSSPLLQTGPFCLLRILLHCLHFPGVSLLVLVVIKGNHCLLVSFFSQSVVPLHWDHPLSFNRSLLHWDLLKIPTLLVIRQIPIVLGSYS